MPKYLVPVSCIKLGYAEMEGDSLQDVLEYGNPNYASITAERETSDGWGFAVAGPYMKYNEAIDDWENCSEED